MKHASAHKHKHTDGWYCKVTADDGRITYSVVNETYAVANAVAEAINHPELWEPTEAYEIAERRQS